MASTFSGVPAALRPPAGIVLVSGALLVIGAWVLPGAEPYRGGVTCLLGLTIICGGLLALGQIGAPPRLATVRSEDLSRVRRIRDEMGARIATLAPDNPMRRDFPELLERLDREVIPRLAELIAKHEELARRLSAYDSATGSYRPDAATLQRLRSLYTRQAGQIQGLVQQIVTMDAALLGLIQEGDEQHMMGQVRSWAEEMDVRWQSLAEVLAEEPLPAPPKQAPPR